MSGELRRIEKKILDDIEIREKGITHFRGEGNDHMVHVTKAERKVLENVLAYVRAELSG